jgi:hypothetical protein
MMSEADHGTLGATWARLVEEVVTGMRDRRTAHPRATFAELEAAVEERPGVLRARMLEEAALTAASAVVPPASAPCCALCGAALAVRATPERTLRVQGDRRVRLRRPYLTCTACGRGAFPPG